MKIDTCKLKICIYYSVKERYTHSNTISSQFQYNYKYDNLVLIMRARYKNNYISKSKLSRFVIPVFLILLADGIMAYVFPVLAEQKLNSNTQMGIIMAFSSVAGIVMDLIIPQIFKSRSWKPMLVTGIALATLFPLLTHLASNHYPLILFTFASIVWGIYFEFIGFSQQDFVVTEEPKNEFSKAWGILSSGWDLTMIIAPILGAYLLKESENKLAVVVIGIQILALSLASLILKSPKNKSIIKETSEVKYFFKIVKEVKIIEILGEKIYPIVFLGFCVSLITSTYWTIGALFGVSLSENTAWLIIVLNSCAMLLGESLTIRLKIKTRKKFISQISVLIASLLLTSFFLNPSEPMIYIIITISAFFVGFAFPLNEAVYSDLSKRSKEAEMLLLSIARMTISFSYIIGPLVTGFLSDRIGYEHTFGAIGAICLIISIFLLIITPKKIHLPQKQLNDLV